jgi:hypothetical protein
MSVRTNREITSHQIADCLHVVATTSQFLTHSGDFKDTSANGDHRTTLEVTLTKACDRLEKILDDDTRWGVQPVDGHSYAAALCGEQYRQVATGTRIVNQRLDIEAQNAVAIKEDANRHVAHLISMMAQPPTTKRKRKSK